ncbi:MAG: hypothetical protein NWF04_10130 [Candidatus Bathyarchaeota archaeon]|nr:hypothetical protein [Candidatus Bathyarchaeota archaeon]
MTNESVDIPELPDIPPELRDKINDKKAAFFLGSGVSMLIGCAGWDTLAKKLVEKCFENEYYHVQREREYLTNK